MSGVERLKPCPNPWCDSGVQPMSFSMRGGFHQVICGCDFKGPRKATKEEAEAAWNRRAPSVPTEQADGGVVAALRAEAQRRHDAGEGCGKCVYCRDLGAPELCRHYDLALAKMELELINAARRDEEAGQ